MKPHPPFDLNKAIAAWRAFQAQHRTLLPEDLNELESHLWDHSAALIREGLDDETAFRQALLSLGDLEGAEYGKVYWRKLKTRRNLAKELSWRFSMLKNHFKIALRNLRKHKGYAFINITGLVVGLACSFFILLWLQDELGFDRYLNDGDRIHQVLRNVHIGDQIYTWSATSKPLKDVLEDDFPAIEKAVHSFGGEFVVTVGGKSYREAGNFASEDFFDVFPLPFIQGNPESALAGENSIVLTDRTARKLFGEDWQLRGDVIGKSLTIDHRKDFTITGVMEDLPTNSSYQTGIVLPAQDFFSRNEWVERWGNNGFPLYVKLVEGASPAEVSDQIAGVVMANEEGADEALFLQPYEDRYLYSTYANGQLVGGRIEYVRIFSVIAIFLLIIAAINFTNLATARSARRAREIGVRKAIGAGRLSLTGQFLSEAVFLALIAYVFATVLILLLTPAFNELTGKNIVLADLNSSFLTLSFGITLLVGLLAGAYPALYLSSFNPLSTLKGVFNHRPSAATLRKGLVVFQFSLSVLLIVATMTVYQQIEYIKTRDLGFDRDNIVYVAQEGALNNQYDVIRQELLNRPGIEAVTASNSSPLSIRGSTGGATWEGKLPDEEYEISIVSADYDFIETMKMNVVAGRSFSRDFGADSAGIIINEVLAEILGGDDVLGQAISYWGGTSQVIGVLRDFDMNSLYNPIEPVIIRLAPENTSILYARLGAGQTSEGIESIKAVVEAFNPQYPFEYHFLDQDFEAAFRSEAVLEALTKIMTVIAIFVSCLGLIGLISYSAEQRTKEIGIRKVLGASVPNLVRLLTGEITVLVLVGIALATPISFFIVQNWLADFEHHIDTNIGLFAMAGGAAIGIALLTVSFQSIKAALANPVQSLRNE